MKSLHLLPLCFVLTAQAFAGVRVPAFTAYLEPDGHGATVSEEKGVTGWNSDAASVSWFGELKAAGKLTAVVEAQGAASRLRLKVGDQAHEALVKDGRADFGEYTFSHPGYQRFQLFSLNGDKEAGNVQVLVLDGPAVAGAHFNLKPRRNAASVHLAYPTAKDEKIAAFYNEVTAVEDPPATYYMACGFTRGYFGMQVNSPTERRIIFSVWDAASGEKAKDRSTVSKEDETRLVAKGEGVEASVFGNEGTGGHSHLVYPWKTGQAQRFVVTVKPSGSRTIYSGWWFHPDKQKWQLLATFDAPKDGGWLRGLYSFSEDFDGGNGQLRRKALYGPQWIRLADGRWKELTKATFSHDPTGKTDRLDRFMGMENGRFFLSQGGFIPGFTKFGEPFTRPVTGKPPVVALPEP